MAAHEARCFNNPNRICPLCKNSPGQTPLVEIIAALDGIDYGNKAEKIKAAEQAASGCPACTLAALNQIPPMEVDYDVGDPISGIRTLTRKEKFAFHYDYKTARSEWIADTYDRPGFSHCP